MGDPAPPPSSDARPTSREQDAVRILLLLRGAGEQVEDTERHSDPRLATAQQVVRTTVRLMKLDFWLRNPDYLALELLNDYEASREEPLLNLAGQILDSEEPEVRRYPMLRHRFGAWESIDNAFAVLRSAGLAEPYRTGTVDHVRQSDYYLLARGQEVADEIVAMESVFGYYVDRVDLVVRLADGLGGSQLKARQYLQREYAETRIGDRIAPVAVRARERLAALRAELDDQLVTAGVVESQGTS